MYGDRINNLVRQESDNQPLIKAVYKILFSRYASDANMAIENLISEFGETPETLLQVIVVLRDLLDRSQFSERSALFPETQIPRELLINNRFARDYLRTKLEELLVTSQQKGISRSALREFLMANHEWIKWSLNIWFIVNSGTLAELVIMDESVEPTTLDWIRQEFGVEVGQPITHPHLISENGKKRLAIAGFPNIESHLTREDYAQMLVACYQLSIATEGSKGLFARSWIYDPRIHIPLSDGKPFAAFDFLQHDYMAGIRKRLVTASPSGKFSDQYAFATRNQRRRELVESGEFNPEVYAVTHTNESLKTNIDKGLFLSKDYN
jgi:hypothetical protein